MQLLGVLRAGRLDGGGTWFTRAKAGAIVCTDAGLGRDCLADDGRAWDRTGRCCASLPGLEHNGRATAADALDVKVVAADIDPLSRERCWGRRRSRRRRGYNARTNESSRMAMEFVGVVALVLAA